MGLLPSWTADQYIALLACMGEFAFAAIALARQETGFLVWLTGLLSLDIACWNFAHVAFAVSGQLTWQWLHVALSPWTPPLALAFVATFVGKRRTLRRSLRAAFIAFGAISAVGVLAFFFEGARLLVLSPAWSWVFLLLLVPTTLGVFVLLGTHLAEEPNELERKRTTLLTSGLAIACLGAATDPILGRGSIPPLVSLGFLTGNLILLVVALKVRAVEQSPPLSLTLLLLAAALGVSLVLLQVFRAFSTRVAVQVFAAMLLTAMVLAIGLPLWVFRRKTSRHRRHLMTLGRLSDQMAHDLAGPLAALGTALDWLEVDLARSTVLTRRQTEMLELMLKQVRRSERLLRRFRRMGELRVEPQLVDLNALLSSELSFHQLASKKIALGMVLAPPPVKAMVDEDVFSVVVNNLVRNSVDAMPSGGVLTVATEAVQGPVRGARIRIKDTGKGMNPRVLERAGDEGFTTKTDGTGLGLASSRRVMRAHGGYIKITSHEGQGTEVELYFPGP